jgi:hypothetical protein
MIAFVANPADAAAIAALRADPAGIGQIATTCVPTMVSGGHAPNARGGNPIRALPRRSLPPAPSAPPSG